MPTLAGGAGVEKLGWLEESNRAYIYSRRLESTCHGHTQNKTLKRQPISILSTRNYLISRRNKGWKYSVLGALDTCGSGTCGEPSSTPTSRCMSKAASSMTGTQSLLDLLWGMGSVFSREAQTVTRID